MVNNVGSILTNKGEVLLKMWEVDVSPGKREERRHFHIPFEIMQVDSGGGIYRTGMREYNMQKGDIFTFAGNEPHCITEVFDEGLKILNIHFEVRYLLGNQSDSLSENNAALFFSHGHQFFNRLPRKDSQTEKIRLLINEIRHEFFEQEAEYPVMIKSRLNEILVLLIRNMRDSKGRMTVPASGNSHLCSIRRAIDYIENNIGETLTLKNISDAAGMSPAYFSTVFKQTIGISLWDYIRSLRIEKAMHIISGGEGKTILDIAIQCGFNNTANFNKAFRAHTGITPSQYRKNGTPFLY